MSNFIDHWLNSIPIEEATRAKKLKRKGMISPEDYAKAEQTLEQTLSRYVTDDPEKMHYITFISDMATAKEIGDDERKGRKKSPSQSKVGINPQSRYDTPNGIYSYPLTREMFKSLLDGAIGGHGFAQSQPFIGLFKPKNVDKILFVKPEKEEGDEDAGGWLNRTGNTVAGVLEEDPDSQLLKDSVYKLLSKESTLRKKVRDTNIEDYESGKKFVREVEADFLLKEIQRLGLDRAGEFKIDSEVFKENEKELLQTLESSDLADWMKPIGTRFIKDFTEAGDFGPSNLSSDNSLIMAYLLSEIIERNNKAVNDLSGPKGLNTSIYEFYYRLLDTFKFECEYSLRQAVFRESGYSEQIKWSGGFNDTSYLTYFMKYTLLISIMKIFREITTEASTDELRRIFRQKYIEISDFADAITVDGVISSSSINKMLGWLFNVLTAAALKIRDAKTKVPVEKREEYEKYQKIVLFYRKVAHPSRIGRAMQEVLRSNAKTFISDGKQAIYPKALSTLANNLAADLQEDSKITDLMNSQEETGLFSNGLFLHLYVLSSNEKLSRKFFSLLKDSYKPMFSYSEFNREEQQIARMLTRDPDISNSPKKIAKFFIKSDLKRRDYNSLANKLYNPTAEQLLQSSVIQEVFRQSRQKSATGFLWNFTRNFAGISSQYTVKYPTKPKNPAFPYEGHVDDPKPVGFKKVPALWNTVLRFIGYDGVSDLQDSGIIHPAEKTQAVFFNSSFIEIINIYKNDLVSGSRKESTEEFAEKLKLMALAGSINHFAKAEVVTKQGQKFIFPEASMYSEGVSIPDMHLVLPSIASKSGLEDKYKSLASDFLSLETYQDLSKFNKNKDLANLYIIYKLARTELFGLGFNFYNRMRSKLPNKLDDNDFDSVVELELYYLLTGYLMHADGTQNFQYMPNLERKLPEGINLGSITREIEDFLLPASIIKAIAKRGFDFPNHIYSEDDIVRGKIKTDYLFNIKNGMWNINALPKTIFDNITRSILDESLDEYTLSLKNQLPVRIKNEIKTSMNDSSLNSDIEAGFNLHKKVENMNANTDENWSNEFSSLIRLEKKIVSMLYREVEHEIIKTTPFSPKNVDSYLMSFTSYRGDYGLKTINTIEEYKEHLFRITFVFLCMAFHVHSVKRFLNDPSFFKDDKEDMPLQEINRLIKEMENILNE